ncbi:MAG: pitrilysin family protein [Bacteroidales bacterium]|jgi:predicted Zn-dependent peptidase|nr:pitrilysin family protein [Bacteroidales bacterium]
MITFEKFVLENGLKVIVHQDQSTPLVTVNLLYNVGSRDEKPDKTGFAHLFEHLMFEGSKNIASFDTALQKAGGENNAFTNNDITNYYITLPKENIETAFWLESDRMLNLDFSENKLSIQKNVVIEEYNQRYLNQPYGEASLLIRPLAYKKHPYRWPTIGKDIAHIRNATLQDVKDFFMHHYAPNNAILSVAGNVKPEEAKKLADKWFGPIEKRKIYKPQIIKEPQQTEPRFLEVKREVPVDAIYKAYHMSARNHQDYYVADLISDLLANGKSARLYQRLVKQKQLFSEINAYITGDVDEGLFMVTGKTMKGVPVEKGEEAIHQELNELINKRVNDREIEKVKNKYESVFQFAHLNALNKAMDLAYHELLGDAEEINMEVQKFRAVTQEDVQQLANKLFHPDNSSTLYYLSQQ